MLQSHALYYALTAETFSGKRAAEIGLVAKAVPKAQLKTEVQRVAEVLRDKDPVALRVTKDAVKLSRLMDYETAYAYSRALANDLLVGQKGTGLTRGLEEFVQGKFRPGLEAMKR